MIFNKELGRRIYVVALLTWLAQSCAVNKIIIKEDKEYLMIDLIDFNLIVITQYNEDLLILDKNKIKFTEVKGFELLPLEEYKNLYKRINLTDGGF